MSINRWLDKEEVVHIYNEKLLSCPQKKKWNNIICSNIDGPRDWHTEWSKSDREREISYDSHYIWNLKRNDPKWTYLQNRYRLRTNLQLPEEGWGEGIVREFRMDMYTLLYLKWITNKEVLYGTWNSAQCYVAIWVGEEVGGEGIHIHEGQVPSLFTWNYHIINQLHPKTK